MGVGFSRLAGADAWCVLGLCMMGVANAAYAAQTWRKPAALGFSFAKERTRVVHDNKVMHALKEAERGWSAGQV